MQVVLGKPYYACCQMLAELAFLLHQIHSATHQEKLSLALRP